MVDVFVNVLGSHADAHIAHGDSAGFFVDGNSDLQVAEFAFIFANRRKCFEFLRSVDSVRNEFAKEDFVVAV